ncbi:predicted protein [Naegleria gruberi]|uniref:Predicted protein n=1 Tax=Naegleria gruberi TaxID=5762 RepID=D2VMW7_NAEGR|nr:uncharacterized protein NAEGRDRAFT_70286 [Naegleria gruberi]EFC41814.1 predicted protein [Naegleria gruberi]|eukprot:XP_002674558.1 predicted protein [Naegleria gruberi strain NEG-M]
MIIFIPSFRRSIKNPAYYLCILGLVFLVLAIVYSVYFSSNYADLQPKAAICSVFDANTKRRICSEADCQLVKKFNVNSYKLPTRANIHYSETKKMDHKFTISEQDIGQESPVECIAGMTTCYEPGWDVNSNLNEWIRRISTNMVTTDKEQALNMVQSLTNSTADTFWNCYERFEILNWYLSDFPFLLPTTDLILICVFYPLSILVFSVAIIFIWWRVAVARKNRAPTTTETSNSKVNSKKKQSKTKSSEKQPLVINAQPNNESNMARTNGNSMV